MRAEDSKTEQFRVQLPKATIRRMKRLASQFGKRSAGTVGTEVISFYLELWAKAQEQHKEAVAQTITVSQ